ncbi:hypothetical protein GCM10009573_23840 [Agromyces bracchium]
MLYPAPLLRIPRRERFHLVHDLLDRLGLLVGRVLVFHEQAFDRCAELRPHVVAHGPVGAHVASHHGDELPSDLGEHVFALHVDRRLIGGHGVGERELVARQWEREVRPAGCLGGDFLRERDQLGDDLCGRELRVRVLEDESGIVGPHPSIHQSMNFLLPGGRHNSQAAWAECEWD